MKNFEIYLKNKKHIIWDWNGTLLDDLVHTWQTGNRLLEKEGFESVSLDYYRDHFCFPVSKYYRGLGFNVDDKEYFKSICHFFVSIYMEKISECSIKKGMDHILEAVRKKGLAQSILSAADQDSLNQMVKQQGVSHYFENIFGLSNKEATCKISRGSELIKKLSQYKNEELLIVGDTLHDLEVGQKNNVDVVLVAHGHNSPKKLKSHHKWVFDLNS